MYYLIDKDLKSNYVTLPKYGFLFFLCLTFILIILSVFYLAALVFSVMFAFSTLMIFIVWKINKKICGKKISFTSDTILIYNYKDIKINEYRVENLKKKYIEVGFPDRYGFRYKNYLILYFDFEPYEKMEYGSYWKDPNVIIIQNAELFDAIDKLIK